VAKIRELTRDDIPQFVQLYRRVSSAGTTATDEKLVDYFRKIYFDHPWFDERFPSWVYEEPGAGIVGFLGVTHRPMTFRGRLIHAVISTNFMVDPEFRTSLAGISLMKAYFSGSQDLSLCEGNDKSRALWQALGGSISLSHSLRWTIPLRPVGYLFRHLGLPRAAAALPDAIATRLPRSSFRRTAPELNAEKLLASTFVECLETYANQHVLRPLYDEQTSGWMLRHLERKNSVGTLHGTVLRDDAGKICGMHLWYSNRRGTARLVHLVARDEALPAVLTHLLHAAWTSGAVALSGKLEPELISWISGNHGLLGGGRNWMLIHGPDPAIIGAIQSGNARITWLESEWWVNYAEDDE